MGREQMSIEGRDDVRAALRSALRDCANAPRLVVVRGGAGLGKTRLLEATARRWRSRGVRVAHLRASAADPDRPDQHGVGALVDALRRDFDQFSDCGLVEAISELARFQQGEAAVTGPRFAAVAAELNWVFGRIGSLGTVAVLIDDVLQVPDPVPLLLAARRPGCVVIASVRDDAPGPAATELLGMADEVLDLDVLADEHIERIVGDLDASAHEALRAALGPLYGNPGTVLATVAELVDQEQIMAGDTGFRLVDPDAPIKLPEDHELLRRAASLGHLGPRLLAAAARRGELDVDELAAVADALGSDVAECGRTLDLLVEHGLLVSDPRGWLRCLCPALAASVAGHAATPRLPAPQRELRTSPVVRSIGSAAAWSLSDTEARIVELVSQGFTNRRIGARLGLSEKAVERQLTRLFAKTGCRSRVELVTTAPRRRGATALRGWRAA
ncbi:LuxR C-terminal-related transcriptional regulator [Saccharopolyspora sp. NPDC000359]|uniref:helix-turn-helix transcriptional regulator n=1 Tax=Saccharopolyspora sp. NPDC000359 TaxID=3154251 RepID=UPI0033166E7A